MTKHIAKEWASYVERVLPTNAEAVQRRETRRAFYAGAQALLGVLMRALDPGEEPTAGDYQRLADIDDELQAFLRDVTNGRA